MASIRGKNRANSEPILNLNSKLHLFRGMANIKKLPLYS